VPTTAGLGGDCLGEGAIPVNFLPGGEASMSRVNIDNDETFRRTCPDAGDRAGEGGPPRVDEFQAGGEVVHTVGGETPGRPLSVQGPYGEPEQGEPASFPMLCRETCGS